MVSRSRAFAAAPHLVSSLGGLFACGLVVCGLMVCGLSACNVAPEGGDPLPRTKGELAGTGDHLVEINDPASPKRPEGFPETPWRVSVGGAVVTAVDMHDEAKDGRVGTVYLQDLGAPTPFGGISTFAASFQPPSYRPSVGDVVDVSGLYQETPSIGATVVFPEGTFLPQLSRPTLSLRFEAKDPEPVVIDVEELRTFESGRKWIGMLVRVENVTLREGNRADTGGRLGRRMVDGSERNLPEMTNELMPLDPNTFAPGRTITSLTGVVTFFYNLRIAPRKPSDVVLPEDGVTAP